jgi:hypothetical protein
MRFARSCAKSFDGGNSLADPRQGARTTDGNATATRSVVKAIDGGTVTGAYAHSSGLIAIWDRRAPTS